MCTPACRGGTVIFEVNTLAGRTRRLKQDRAWLSGQPSKHPTTTGLGDGQGCVLGSLAYSQRHEALKRPNPPPSPGSPGNLSTASGSEHKSIKAEARPGRRRSPDGEQVRGSPESFAEKAAKQTNKQTRSPSPKTTITKKCSKVKTRQQEETGKTPDAGEGRSEGDEGSKGRGRSRRLHGALSKGSVSLGHGAQRAAKERAKATHRLRRRRPEAQLTPGLEGEAGSGRRWERTFGRKREAQGKESPPP